MTPFNLELAKAGKPVVTRDGRKWRFLAHEPRVQRDCRVVGVIEEDSPYLLTSAEDGSYHGCGTERPSDLFMAPDEKVEWWVITNDYEETGLPSLWMQESKEYAGLVVAVNPDKRQLLRVTRIDGKITKVEVVE